VRRPAPHSEAQTRRARSRRAAEREPSGLRLEIVDGPFAQTFTGGAEPFDVAVSHITITGERAKSVDLSAPYFVVNKGVLVSSGVTAQASLAELRSRTLKDRCQATASLTTTATTPPGRRVGRDASTDGNERHHQQG
jgi:ABC-type amino acid transport substrate-binding protein